MTIQPTTHAAVHRPPSDPWAAPQMPGGLRGMSLSIAPVEQRDPRLDAYVPVHPLADAPRIASLPRPGAKHDARTRAALASGAPVGPAAPLQSGTNKGLTTVQRFAHPSLPRTATDAVVKPIAAGGPQEVFAARFGEAIGAGHLFAGTVRRSDGSAAIEFVPGETLQSAGIRSADDLDLRLRDAMLARDPSMPVDVATRRARIDRQLLQTLDVLLGNRDRHGDNALFDAERGVLTLIDHGLTMEAHGSHDLSTPFHAYMDDRYLTAHAAEGVGQLRSIPLDPEVVARVAHARDDFSGVREAFEVMQRDLAGRADAGSLATGIPDDAIRGLMARMDDVVGFRALRFLA